MGQCLKNLQVSEGKTSKFMGNEAAKRVLKHIWSTLNGGPMPRWQTQNKPNK